MILTGQAGAKFIAEYGSITNVYTSLRKCEELTVQGLIDYFNYLKEQGHYSETTDIRGVWSVDKAQSHEITVECFGQTSITEGFNQNSQDVEWTDENGTKTYKFIGGRYEFTIEVKCRSLQRSSVMYLGDAVVTGLQTNVDNWLKQNSITIPANAIRVTQKPVRVQITKDLSTWEVTINAANVGVEWAQLLEINGEVLRDIGYYITYINE